MMSSRWWQGHHHPVGGCQRSWEATCHHSCPFALQAAERGLWQVIGDDSARLACYSHWSGQYARVGQSFARVWYLRMLCASPGGVRIGARHVSSWGVRMELLRIAVRATCYQGEGSLHYWCTNLWGRLFVNYLGCNQSLVSLNTEECTNCEESRLCRLSFVVLFLLVSLARFWLVEGASLLLRNLHVRESKVRGHV